MRRDKRKEFYESREKFPERKGLGNSVGKYQKNPSDENLRGIFYTVSTIIKSWARGFGSTRAAKENEGAKGLFPFAVSPEENDAVVTEIMQLIDEAYDLQVSTYSSVNRIVNTVRAKLEKKQRRLQQEKTFAVGRPLSGDGIWLLWRHAVSREVEYAADSGLISAYTFYILIARYAGYTTREAADLIYAKEDALYKHLERVKPRLQAILNGEEVEKLDQKNGGRPPNVDLERLEWAIHYVATK